MTENRDLQELIKIKGEERAVLMLFQEDDGPVIFNRGVSPSDIEELIGALVRSPSNIELEELYAQARESLQELMDEP
jgi:hypothetical protein